MSEEQQKLLKIPLSKEHVFIVGVNQNKIMNKWEAVCVIGNLETEQEALDAAAAIRGILWKEFNVDDVKPIKEH